MATTNGSTAIRDKILASLARYRALRIGKFPCAFWRLSSRPGLTAAAAAMGKPETKVSDLCKEIGITRQTLYRYVAPDGSLRESGKKVLKKS